MPVKTINDYVFYKIVCLDDSVELCYVGSTADFNKRRQKHKHSCTNEMRKEYNSKKYQIIRENGGWDNFKMVQLGTREQLTKRQAEQVEEEYRVQLKADMNSKRCYLTQEDKQEHNKKYREENADKIKERDKKYREVNADKINEYSKKYYEENKDKINEKKAEKITCECGCEISRIHLSTHRKSKKHQELMSTENK